jgi:hypothetical protein
MKKHPSTFESTPRSAAYRMRPLTRQSPLCLGYPAFANNANGPMTFDTNSKSCKQANHET